MLSIIVPGIRTKNWVNLYKSVSVPIDSFEMIFIGPYYPWDGLPFKNLKYIHSFRSPNACQQQALSIAEGDYVTWAADDGEFLPYSLEDLYWNLKFSVCADIIPYKNIVVGRYLEGDNPIGMKSEDYYRFKYHKPYRLAGINPEWLIFNCGIISRQFLLELGGWDAENFEVPTIAHADLGIRAQKAGAKMVLMKEPMFKCSHQPGKSGDHAPIHNAQTKRDMPKFQEMYAKPNDRINIDINNWKNTPEKWSERFGR